jgi:hypothetical protein
MLPPENVSISPILRNDGMNQQLSFVNKMHAKDRMEI